jgi:hypothetical protein
MQLGLKKAVLVTLWVLAICVAGFAVGATSIAAWIVLGSLALLPAVVVLRLWQDPPKSLSESINEGRR